MLMNRRRRINFFEVLNRLKEEAF